MARVTLNGEIARFSLKCGINPSEWNPGTGRVIGKSVAAQKLNGLLDNFRASLTQHYRDISDREATVTAEKVRNALLGLQMWNDSLLDLFEKHCKNLEIQVGKGVSLDTHQKYLRTANRLRDFMNYRYHISDINLKEVRNLPFH
jgi:paraquat-inducible protein B